MRKITSFFVLIAFVLSCAMPPQGFAQSLSAMGLMPEPGTMVELSGAFVPTILKGMKVYPAEPLRFDFLLDTGHSALEADSLQKESTKLIRYFLASLTVPEEDLWVNLSPYENDRIIPDNFGLTEMGRDLLAEDYILKQLTSSLMYPEKELGRALWKKIYALAYEKYGTTDIPFDTFNKVWIMPDEATVYVNGNTALIASSHLKVMLDTDYLAMSNQPSSTGGHVAPQDPGNVGEGSHALPNQLPLNAQTSEGTDQTPSEITKTVLREIVIPELEREVNTGKNFSTLRQIYHAMVLSTWFKRNMQKSLVGQAYTDKNKVSGIDLADKEAKDKIWSQYVEAFKKGAFNYIKEEKDEGSQETIPRKYFSGGFHDNSESVKEKEVSEGEIVDMAAKNEVGEDAVVKVKLDPIQRMNNDVDFVISPDGVMPNEAKRNDLKRNIIDAFNALAVKAREAVEEKKELSPKIEGLLKKIIFGHAQQLGLEEAAITELINKALMTEINLGVYSEEMRNKLGRMIELESIVKRINTEQKSDRKMIESIIIYYKTFRQNVRPGEDPEKLKNGFINMEKLNELIAAIELLPKTSAIEDILTYLNMVRSIKMERRIEITGYVAKEKIQKVQDIIQWFPKELTERIRIPVELNFEELNGFLGVAGRETVAGIGINQKISDDEELEHTIWHELMHKYSLASDVAGQPLFPVSDMKQLAKKAGFVGALIKGVFVPIDDQAFPENYKEVRNIEYGEWIREEGGQLICYSPLSYWNLEEERKALYKKHNIRYKFYQKGEYWKTTPKETIAEAGAYYVSNSNERRDFIPQEVFDMLRDSLFTGMNSDGVPGYYVFDRKKGQRTIVPSRKNADTQTALSNEQQKIIQGNIGLLSAHEISPYDWKSDEEGGHTVLSGYIDYKGNIVISSAGGSYDGVRFLMRVNRSLGKAGILYEVLETGDRITGEQISDEAKRMLEKTIEALNKKFNLMNVVSDSAQMESIDMLIDANGPVDHAMSDVPSFKASAMREIRVDKAVRNVFKRSGLDMNANYVSFRKDMPKILNEILKESTTKDDPKDALFSRMVGKALREDSIAYYIEEFGRFGPKDIILLLQRLHTLSGDLALYGVKEQTMEEEFVLVFVRQSVFFSHALYYRIIERAGFAGDAWEAVNADQQALAWLAGKRYRDILISMQGKRLVDVMPAIKAVTDAFDINVLAIQNIFLQGIVQAQQSQSAIELMSTEEQEKTIGSLGHELANNFLKDFMLILVVSNLSMYRWGRDVQKFIGRGADGIVLKAVTPERSPRVLKFNFPTNGLSPEDFFRILKSVVLAIQGDGKVKRAGFVETFMTEIISLPWFDGSRMTVVVEENAFVEGIPLRTMVSQDKPQPDEILSLVEQFVSLHQFLDSQSFFNRDAQNLNNILVDALGQEELVDYGNILTMEAYVEYLKKAREGFNNLSFKEVSQRALEENKKDIVLALVRMLTGVQFRFVNGVKDEQRMQAFMVERFGIEQALRLKPVIDVLLKASDDPAVKFAALAAELMDVIGKIDKAQNDMKEFSSTNRAKVILDLPAATLDLPERSSAVDFAMGWALGGLLDKFKGDGKASAIKPQINEERLTRMLVENGKLHKMELKADGIVLLQDIFEKHMKRKQAMIVQGVFGELKTLSSGLWAEIAAATPAGAFGVISNWMIARFKELNDGTHIEKDIADFTIDATRFAQLVIAGDVSGTKHDQYDKDHRSMVSLLNSKDHKWNCQAISDMTAVLLGLWGARGVSVVEVDQGPDGVQYPKDGVGHAANLVRVGSTVAYLDQGAPAVSDKGRVFVIANGKRIEKSVSIGSIGSLPDAEGLTIERIFELAKAENMRNLLSAKLNALPEKYNENNVTAVIAALKPLKMAWQELSERVVDKKEDPVLVTELDATFKLNMDSLIKTIDENLERSQALGRTTSDLDQLLAKHSDLIAVETTARGKSYGYQISMETAPYFLKEIPGFLAELDAILGDQRQNPIFKTNVQSLKDLLIQANAQAADMVKKQQVNDQINVFIGEYNTNQLKPLAMQRLRSDIEEFVKLEKKVFRSDEQLANNVKRIYKIAGGDTRTLDLAMRIQDQASDVGGIDLNSDQLKLNETGGKIDFNGAIDPAMLAKIDGFSPVVLSVTPLGDPQSFFGAMKN